MDASRLERAAKDLRAEALRYFTLRELLPTEGIVRAVIALDEALAAPAEDEVVAWAVVDSCGYRSVAFQRPRADGLAHDEEVVPLYAHPTPPAPLSADQQAVAEELAHLGKCAVALDAVASQPNAWAKPERDTFNAALAAFGRLMVECAARKRKAREEGA